MLQIRTVPDPRPRNEEVCIRLVATAVTASDCIVRRLKLSGVYRLFKPGDQVKAGDRGSHELRLRVAQSSQVRMDIADRHRTFSDG
jgi:hypothetical protein